jgi:hypothetical protein
MIGQKKILLKIASDLSVDAIFPFEGPPFIPILTWAQRAEPIHPYPFGAFVHPVYGLWYSFRGVLLFKKKLHYLNWGILHPRAKSAMINPAKQRALSGQLKAVILAPKLA